MYLFVYGSLKKGALNHDIIEKASFYSEAFINGTLYDLGVDFPAVADEKDPVRSKVYGEVYAVSEDLLAEIDEFEGFYPEKIEDSVFVRKEIKTFLPDRNTLNTQVYVMPPEKLSQFFAIELKDGKWRG